MDAETGNYYYGQRYYDPTISIWLSVDPLAHEFPFWTPYHYVHNNPINLIDPTGMSAIGPGDPNNEFGDDVYVGPSAEVTAEGPRPTVNNTYAGPYSSEYYNQQNNQNSNASSAMSRFYDGLVAGGEDIRNGLISTANNLIDGDPETWQSLLRDPLGVGQPSQTSPQLPGSPEEFGYDVMMALPMFVTKGKSPKVSGWIKRSVFNSLDPAIRKKFKSAIANGIVAPTGQQGIIKLTATEAAQTGFSHKVKILGKGGDLRIYGNQGTNGHIYFEKLSGH